MKTRSLLPLVILTILQAACTRSLLPSPTPNYVPSTPTDRPTPALLPTHTLIPPPATATHRPTVVYPALATLSVSPTPVPGWKTYTNAFLGYSLNHPVNAIVAGRSAGGMDMEQVLPPGFTFDSYFDYIMAISPAELCVSISIPGALVTILPPYDPFGSYVGPCPGMGIGSGYTFENTVQPAFMAGRVYENDSGSRAYLEAGGAFAFEYYIYNLDNGFRVVVNGSPEEGMSPEVYAEQRAQALEMLATLHWFRVPDLTKPGTTCAGADTHLLAGVEAVVSARFAEVEVRSEPSPQADLLARLPAGSRVFILSGPVCSASGHVFWQVQNDSIPGGSGWAVEQFQGEYWLDRPRP